MLYMFWNVTNLDLTLHGDAEEHYEVHHEDRPEHWYVEGFKERANHSDDDAFCSRMPESTNKKNIIWELFSFLHFIQSLVDCKFPMKR